MSAPLVNPVSIEPIIGIVDEGLNFAVVRVKQLVKAQGSA
jgi:hypothetical protein